MAQAQDAPDSALLTAAREGDEHAFRRLVEPHRRELHTHCYRMLGSLHDTEDVLQETLLRAWRGLDGFGGQRLRPWLYRIATNACIDALGRRSKRELILEAGDPSSSAEEGFIEPYPDHELGLEEGYAVPEARYEQREAIELAFIAALQHLSPRQRAVLILRDVLSFSAREVAQILEISTAAVNSALQRARATVEERTPARSQQQTLRALGSDHLRELVQRFVTAFEHGDVDTILSLLTDDALFAMPPYSGIARGREAIGKSWLMPEGLPPLMRYRITSANGQPALGTYRLDRDRGAYLPIALDVLAIEGDRVSEVIAFRMPELFDRFGLPEQLDA